jgi:hypothetical protein
MGVNFHRRIGSGHRRAQNVPLAHAASDLRSVYIVTGKQGTQHDRGLESNGDWYFE